MSDPIAGGLYVYGVVAADAGGLPSGGGVGDPPAAVRVVTSGDLGALVSDLPAGPAPGTRNDLEAHQRVLGEGIAEATVLPMRFGVVMDSEDVVKHELLDRHAEELRGLLRDLDGRVQMTVKAYYAEDVLLREVLASDPHVAKLSREVRGEPEETSREARIELGRLVAQAVEERRAHDRERVREAVAPFVADVVDDEPAGERVAAQLQLLVDRDRRGELDEAVETLAAEQAERLAVRYLGPLAPYSFADLQLDTEAGSWA